MICGIFHGIILDAEFISPKVYTFSFILGNIIPKPVSVSTQLLSCTGISILLSGMVHSGCILGFEQRVPGGIC